jgi:hypothetical protein
MHMNDSSELDALFEAARQKEDKEVQPASSLAFNPSLIIPEHVFKKLMYWIDRAPGEVSALGKVTVDSEQNTFKVVDVVLLKQENTGTSTELDGAAIGKAMFNLKDSPGDLRWWIHSHADFSVFWSNTDDATIKQLAMGGWFISTVVNKKREMLSAFSQSTPIRLVQDNIPTKIETKIDEALVAQWDKEYTDNVSEKKYVSFPGSSQNGSVLAAYHSMWPDDDDKENLVSAVPADDDDTIEEVDEEDELIDRIGEIVVQHNDKEIDDDQFISFVKDLAIEYTMLPMQDDSESVTSSEEANAMDIASHDMTFDDDAEQDNLVKKYHRR